MKSLHLATIILALSAATLFIVATISGIAGNVVTTMLLGVLIINILLLVVTYSLHEALKELFQRLPAPEEE